MYISPHFSKEEAETSGHKVAFLNPYCPVSSCYFTHDRYSFHGVTMPLSHIKQIFIEFYRRHCHIHPILNLLPVFSILLAQLGVAMRLIISNKS